LTGAAQRYTIPTAYTYSLHIGLPVASYSSLVLPRLGVSYTFAGFTFELWTLHDAVLQPVYLRTICEIYIYKNVARLRRFYIIINDKFEQREIDRFFS